MKIINLYDLHDAVFVNRPECNSCPSQNGEGMDAQCMQLEEMQHEACPFVEAVLDELHKMETSYYRTLTADLIDHVVDLELSSEENKELRTMGFATFIFANKEVMKPKITEFFVKRITDLNNYRGVLSV